MTLDPQSGQTVSGTTGIEAGRTVTERLRSSSDNPFVLSNQVAVGEGGDFGGEFDPSDVSAPAIATAVASVDGETMAQAQVDVAEASGSAGTGGQPGSGIAHASVAISGIALLLSRRG